MNTLRTTVGMTRFSSFRFVYSIGIIVLLASVGAKANAFELSDLLITQGLTQPSQPSLTEAISEKESDTTDTSNYQLPNSTSRSTGKKQQPSPKIQKDGTVSVDDIPLECRSYFPGKSSVNLFNYQQGIERCRYGDD